MDAKSRFRLLVEKHGWEVTQYNPLQGFGNNWDFELRVHDSNSVKVDVKAAKKISRNDSAPQFDWHWVELKDSHTQEGWIFDITSDWVAFEVEDGFLIVERNKLIRLIENTVDFAQFSSNPGGAKYRIYSRPGKKDALTLIERNAIEEISIAKLLIV